jgi:hypothetical protein
MISDTVSSQKLQLTVIFLVYLIFTSIFGFAYRYAMNPDGISLLRLAGYIAEGNFYQSITNAWSPLLSWLIAPFLYFGVDGLTAARIVIALCGAGMLQCSWFLTLRFSLSKNMRFIAVLIAALLISFWTIQFIASDVLVAALILYYLYLLTDPETLDKRRLSLLCGIVGGFSYLAHHYSFPFFLVHFPILLFLKGYIDRESEGFPWKRILITWGTGMVGFFIIASIWIAGVSIKYGQFTISSKGPIAHAAVGPKDKGHPFFAGGLYKPKDTYAIHVYEDPSEVKFSTWSPFESKENFKYQIGLIRGNTMYLLNHFVKESPFFTYPFMAGTLTLMLLALILTPLNKSKKHLYTWIIATFSIYCSGYLLIIARSPRRFYVLMLVLLFISFHFLEELNSAFKDIVSGRSRKILSASLLIIVILAFSLKPGIHFLKSIKNILTIDYINPYGEIAEQIDTIEFPSPYAIIRSSQKQSTDYYIAYFLRKQLLGRPLSKDLDGITNELTSAGAKSLVVFDNPEVVQEIKSDKRYVHLASLKLKDNRRYEHAINITVKDHEIVDGWDKGVTIFTLNK